MPSAWEMTVRTLVRILHRTSLSKNVYFQALKLKNTFSSNLNTTNLKIFLTMVGYMGLRENETKILNSDKALRVYRNMGGCILPI